jgi:hypothetical protein
MQPTQGPHYVPEAQVPPVGVLRRRLRAELDLILREIKQQAIDDAMTGDISEWATEFLKALRFGDREELIRDNFATLLQELLTDPIYDCPLDVDAILGNDGITYSKKAYEIWKMRVPKEYKNRSPFFPNENVIFTYKMPHPIVKLAVDWLKEHKKMLPLDGINDAYRNECMKKLKEEALNEQNLCDRMRAENDRLMDERVRAQRERVFSPLVNLAKMVDEEADQMRDRVHNQELPSAKEDVKNLKEKLQKLDEEIENLEESTNNLQEDQKKSQKEIGDLTQKSKDLQTSFNNNLKSIKKSKRKRLVGIIEAVAIVGGCYFGGLGFSALTGKSISLVPVPGGLKVIGAIIP